MQTPKAEAASRLSLADAWSTPRVHGHSTPAHTPTFALSKALDSQTSPRRPSLCSPEDPAFHVHHLADTTLPLPPVDPSRRLSSSPGPAAAGEHTAATLRLISASAGPSNMDSSQMHTPPPTRDASSQRNHSQYAASGFMTPVTVVSRNTYQAPPSEPSLTQTPFAFQSLQFSPDTAQFPNTGPLTAPALPQSRLFWDQADMNSMDIDLPLTSDPFGPTPHKINSHTDWPAFGASTPQMNPHAFQALHGMSSPGNCTSFATKFAQSSDVPQHTSSQFLSASASVDPSMLFSFSSPGPSKLSGKEKPMSLGPSGREPYQTQFNDSRRERERERASTSRMHAQHSRTSTSSSNASFDSTRPGLQRRLTDGGYRKRPSSLESRPSGSASGPTIPRRSSPLKRPIGGSLTSIPETKRQVTRLVIDPDGRARTETAPVEDEPVKRRNNSACNSHHELSRQYPALYAQDSDSDTDEEPIMLSRNSSFTMPTQRSSRQKRTESGMFGRSQSLRGRRSSFGYSDTSSFDTIRPRKDCSVDSSQRFSMMDRPSLFEERHEQQPRAVPDSPGDALGALKKVVGERQARIGMVTATLGLFVLTDSRAFSAKHTHSAQPALGPGFCGASLW